MVFVPDILDSASDDQRYRPLAEINVTPLVDVMLVLLVIFMVAAPLMVQGVPVALPRSAAAKLNQVNQPMVVTLARDGTLYVRDEKVEPLALTDRLKTIRSAEGDTIVYVRADKGAAYGDVMELLGRVGTGGYERVSLLAQPTAPAEAVKVH
jgi:biopolymer transport protein TolR